MLIKKNINKIINKQSAKKIKKYKYEKKSKDIFEENKVLISKLNKNEKYILNHFEDEVKDYTNKLLITTDVPKKFKKDMKKKKNEYLDIFVNIINNLDNIFKQMNTLDNIILFKNITNDEDLKKLYFYFLNKKTKNNRRLFFFRSKR